MPYKLDVWADGACRRNGQPGAIGGAGIWFGRPVNGSRGWIRALPLHPIPTNQRAELTAIIFALEMARDRRDELNDRPYFMLTVYTDSKYAHGCMCEWLDQWRDNGWVNSRGVAVVNRDLIQEAADLLDDLENGGEVKFTWIPREQNQDADRLANEAYDKQEYY
ncbi:ribonuclease H-like domain-containing protein [Roridomyces roridus]|uniref:ribonuclease H n=1 Tax=Roridomyces roridus TaxID=1738132 RepID=A0AAD7FTI3_9AGAR|nr:ribonuclease H-like domain-containing protein [Roridomyces roridus]